MTAVIKKIEKIKIYKWLISSYFYDLKKYFKYSATINYDSQSKIIGKIIREYHVIEKGLTMPQPRLGFGREKVNTLCSICRDYIAKYKLNNEQIIHAVEVILEYQAFHQNNNFTLDSEIEENINLLKKLTGNNCCASTQKTIKKEDFFRFKDSPFPQFSNSRSTVRNYTSEKINIDKILNALEIARNTPSACNRQPWRTYVFTNKERIANILEIQGGNRGFGHLTDKLIIITADLGVFAGTGERNQAFIDGGIYTMNLLYALHYNEIGACILNCSNPPLKDRKLRMLSNIKKSEVFIAIIICGIPPDEFKIANSKRYELNTTNSIINE